MPLIPCQSMDAKEVMPGVKTLLQASARLYMHFARETLAAFGREAEMTVRYHLREYGKWRGAEMREAHNALGEPINMGTLNRLWDSASTFIIKDDLDAHGKYAPCDVSFDVFVCPASEAWKAEDFHRWGHVYCDEFHESAASSYHPDGNVVIPLNLMKGDDHCHFRWLMPPNARELVPWPPTELGKKLAQYYKSDSPERAAYNALVRTSRLLGGRFWTAARATLDRHPKAEAVACLKRWLRSWATQRGQMLAAAHKAKGLERSAVNLVRQMDLGCQYVWEMAEGTATPALYEAVVQWTPMDDAWVDLRAAEQADLFWEETFPAMARGYKPSLEVELPALQWRGDSETRLRVRDVASV